MSYKTGKEKHYFFSGIVFKLDGNKQGHSSGVISVIDSSPHEVYDLVIQQVRQDFSCTSKQVHISTLKRVK